MGFVRFYDTALVFFSQTPAQCQVRIVDASETGSCQFGGIGSLQIQGEKPQDLAEFRPCNFAELLILVF